MIIVLEINRLLQSICQYYSRSIVQDTGFSYPDERSQQYHWRREILGYIKWPIKVKYFREPCIQMK